MKKVKPTIHGQSFSLKGNITAERVLKKSFDAYKLSGASKEWAAGFQAAVAWCKSIVGTYFYIQQGANTDEKSEV